MPCLHRTAFQAGTPLPHEPGTYPIPTTLQTSCSYSLLPLFTRPFESQDKSIKTRQDQAHIGPFEAHGYLILGVCAFYGMNYRDMEKMDMIVRILFYAAIIMVLGGTGSYFYMKKYGHLPDVTEISAFSEPAAAQEPEKTEPSTTPALATDTAEYDTAKPIEYWLKRCNDKDTESCEVFQSLSLKENNQRLIEIAVGFPKDMDGQPQIGIIVPLGIAVGKGVDMKVDDKDIVHFDIRTCIPDGCLVLEPMNETLLKSMKSGTKLLATFINNGDQKAINIELALEGFEKALDSLKKE
ncbi:MAG: hypothetical protein DI551_10220 [Micavibrio aeruginosavorus]|uniref:Invasion associated locus B family protein n=1 Tax=Micavibrio aeruginosavorus TaxID=349221 RepID=A0A2W5PIJ4_9BACT|nr:MAG: hypothetical protein DI551_10220 [Micavibrio aeruginosavorus]